MTNILDGIDLRTNYVHFVLAFFKHGDTEIKKQVLGVKGLVSGVFVGMDEDAYPVKFSAKTIHSLTTSRH